MQIGQTYAPAASAPGPGRAGQAGLFNVTEQNYPTQPFAVALSGACANPTVLASAQSGGSYVEQVGGHLRRLRHLRGQRDRRLRPGGDELDAGL
jgi:hypothetical protein